jgi:hypothetical protein
MASLICVAQRVSKLAAGFRCKQLPPAKACSTYVHIDRLPVASVSVQYGRHNHELVFRNKIPDASLVPRCFVGLHGVDVELESRSEREGYEKQCIVEDPE